MTRYLLDTNIVSNLIRPAPSDPLLSWMGEQAGETLYTSALTVAGIRRGILLMPSGRRRERLEQWFSGHEGPQALFAGRILPFDLEAGLAWAALMAEGRAAGRPRSVLDMIVAAIAETQDCIVVTDNERNFAGLRFINPTRGIGGA